MASGAFTESTVGSAALAWLEAIGWRIAHGPDIAPDMPAPERRLGTFHLASPESYDQPITNLAISRPPRL
jgi:hypothetical protein